MSLFYLVIDELAASTHSPLYLTCQFWEVLYDPSWRFSSLAMTNTPRERAQRPALELRASESRIRSCARALVFPVVQKNGV